MKRLTGPQQSMLCTLCKHVWPVCRLPIKAEVLGRILQGAHCPSCNSGPHNLRMLPTRDVERAAALGEDA